jgi:DNA polymerase III sliding clamp (beta) subunit (PCNA family)
MSDADSKTTVESSDYSEAVTEIESYLVDADQVKTLGKADQHIEFLKDEVVKRTRLLERTQEAKKDVMAGWRDTIKAQKENLTDSISRLSSMEDRKRVLAAGSVEE